MARKVESLQEVPDEFIRCRAWRQHLYTWEHETYTTGADRTVIQVLRQQECGRCGRQLESLWEVQNAQWTQLWAHPKDPDDYQVKGGASRDEGRNEFLRRQGKTPHGETPKVVPMRRRKAS